MVVVSVPNLNLTVGRGYALRTADYQRLGCRGSFLIVPRSPLTALWIMLRTIEALEAPRWNRAFVVGNSWPHNYHHMEV